MSRPGLRARLKDRLNIKSSSQATPRPGASVVQNAAVPPIHSPVPPPNPALVDIPVRAQQRAGSANEALWREAQNRVSKKHDQWDVFKVNFAQQQVVVPIEEVLSSLHALQKSYEALQWTVPFARDKKFRSWWDNIAEYAEIFQSAGSAIAGADPTQSAGLAWGIFQSMATVG